MPNLERGDVTLHYKVTGSGPPLLMLAGFMSDHASWTPLVPLLQNHFTCVMPDNRTTGQTAPRDAPASIDVMCRDGLALMDHLGHDRYHVIGHSMGGIIVDGGTFDWSATKGKYPMLSEPREEYAGVVLHEAVGNIAFAIACRVLGLRDFGPAISPFNAFQILTGAATLGLRLQRPLREGPSHPRVSRVDLEQHARLEVFDQGEPDVRQLFLARIRDLHRVEVVALGRDA